MTEFEDCSHGASNMYLPGCAYYVSPFRLLDEALFLSQSSSCQMTFPYSSNLPHVQPVREVAFREYGLERSKWQYRSSYAPYYPAEEVMHRDFLQPANRRTEMLFKTDPVCGHHGPAGAASNFYSPVGRNGILPQGFDQFYETAQGPPYQQPAETEGEAAKSDLKPPASTCSKTPSSHEKKVTTENSAGSPSGEAVAEKSNSSAVPSDQGKRDAPTPNIR